MVSQAVDESAAPTTGAWWSFPLGVWLIWRTAHLLALVAFGGDPVDDAFRFDGSWFVSVLEHGYVVTDPSFETQQNVAFFPGTVWMAEPISWLAGSRVAGLLVSTITSATAFLTVYGATRAATGSDRIARLALVGLAVWPASLVMTAFYSEGLFLTATAGAIWASCRDRRVEAGVAGVLAGFTRSIGFLIGPVLAVARYARIRRVDRTVVMYAASGPVGMGAVAAVQQIQVGRPLAFVEAQAGWDRGLAPPWEPIQTAISGIVEKLPSPAMELSLNLVAILAVGSALAYVTWQFRDRPSAWAYLGWGWVGWFAPLWTAVPSSHVRFALAAWPAFAVAGATGSRRAQWCWRAMAVASIGVSIVLVRRWTTGEFIG